MTEPEEPVEPVDKDLQSWAMLLHLSPLVGGIIGPLVVWLIKKDELPGLEEHFHLSMNFHIVQTVIFFASVVLAFITCGITAPICLAPAIMMMVCSIIAGIKANNGEQVSYPMVIFKALK